jgi:hypothetical protein
MRRCIPIAGAALSAALFAVAAGPQTAPVSAGVQCKPAGMPAVAEFGLFDVNRIWARVPNDGSLVTQRVTSTAGLYWPFRTSRKTAVYAAGFWAAGRKNGKAVTACAEYSSEWSPGRILPGGIPDRADDPRYRLYKVRKADALNPTAHPDWMQWPADLGAPWIDADGDGVYEPLAGDAPDLTGDQMLWCLVNDMTAVSHGNVFGSEPMGLECRVKIWGFDRPDEIGDMMFAEFQVRNTSPSPISPCYFGIWADVDLGVGNDDFTGCDTTLNLGYAYNDGEDEAYGPACPAAGFELLQGPAVPSPGDTARAFGRILPGHANLGMTVFQGFICGGGGVLGCPGTAAECLNCMSGLAPNGTKRTDPTTGAVSYPLRYAPGDPVTGAGWIDGKEYRSGERYLLVSSGPVALAAGDSQEVTAACILAQGTDALSSVTRLRAAARKARILYDRDFKPLEPPAVPIVEIVPDHGRVRLVWDAAAEEGSVEDAMSLDGDGNPSSYRFEGYNVYQCETDDDLGMKARLATFDLADGILDIPWGESTDSLGIPVDFPVQPGSDSGIERSFTVMTDAIRAGVPLVDYRPYYFSVTSYYCNPWGFPAVLESPVRGVPTIPQKPFEIADVRRINVFPNPFFGADQKQKDPSNGFVRFTHLPPAAVIRIYSLSGELTARIEHSSRATFEDWNLKNDDGGRAASGMYVAVVDCGSSGSKALKLAVIVPEE